MNSYRQIELGLIEYYNEVCSKAGFLGEDAGKTIVDAAIEKSKGTPFYNTKIDLVKFLEGIKQDTQQSFAYHKKIEDGVRDEDVLWWWGLDDVERHCLLQFDEISQMSAFLKYTKEDHMAKEDAAQKIMKYYPQFGWWSYPGNEVGEDRVLPVELKERVNVWSMTLDLTTSRKLIEKATSMNAFIRQQLKAGSI